MNDHPLRFTYEQLKGSIKENLMIDKMVTYFIDNDLIDDLKSEISRKVESFCEDDIRDYSIFKMNTVLKYNNKKYMNTDNELFDLFMKSSNDNSYLQWDDEKQLFFIVEDYL